jgi:hypothetical protein
VFPDTPGGGAMRMLGFGGGEEKSVHPGRGSFTQQHNPPNPNEGKVPALTMAALAWKHKYSGPVPFTTILTPGSESSFVAATMQCNLLILCMLLASLMSARSEPFLLLLTSPYPCACACSIRLG